ncbi:MAG: hypothetical protein M1503_03605 [Thaumarchaeota archaeon]|nr:hypothetical protein [Nitrososphaerota archaeon]MCL5317339.1 hypothetical protein [Nitrososphaerota archaeon]
MEKSVSDFESVQKWKGYLTPGMSHMAVENYLWALEVFCNWAKKNPDELILEMVKSASPEEFKTTSSSRITAYQLQDRTTTKRSKALIVKAVASFYENSRSSIAD